MVQSMLDKALALAQLGFHIFPIIEGGKTPAIDGFPVKATRDPEKIRNWWTCPVTGFSLAYNIGISTTRYGDDKALLVVDVDNKKGKDGDAELFKLELDGYDFPRTFSQRTPSGGRHLVYAVERPVRQGVDTLGRGLDIRSRGGYIVGAGSSVEAGHYSADVLGVSVAPEWIVSRCGYAAEREPAAPAPSGVDEDRARRRATDYLDNAAPLAVEGDGGDETTYRVACRVKDFGVDELTAIELMAEHWNERNSPPWSMDELAQKIQNAYRYGKEAPGAAAPEAQFPALVQTEEAKEEGGLHPFEKLNQSYAFVLAGGGHHILWETTDADGRFTLEHLAEASFHRAHAANTMRIETTKGPQFEPVTKLWMMDKRRRSYKGICFRPGKPTPEGFYNLWRGFAVEPYASADEATARDKRALASFLEHAEQNVCNGDKNLARWLIGYFAHMAQRPWEKPLVALVFRGKKGVGKNALIERVGYLLGSHFLLTSSRRYLTSNFNGHLENLLLFTLDEAFWSGDKQAESTLKDLITGKLHNIEHKGKEPYKVDNLTRLAIIGNEDWLVPASHDERRYAVFDVGNGRKQDRPFFIEMREAMEAGGYRLLLRYLLDYDLTGIDVSGAPATRGLLDQKQASLDPFPQWWFECLAEGRLVGSDFGGDWPEEVETGRFRAAFSRYLRDRNIRSRMPDERSLGRAMKDFAPSVDKKRMSKQGDGSQPYAYKLPLLEKARAEWDKFIGHDVEWD